MIKYYGRINLYRFCHQVLLDYIPIYSTTTPRYILLQPDGAGGAETALYPDGERSVQLRVRVLGRDGQVGANTPH